MAHSQKSIYSALLANVLIAITKFIAGAFTNSASMISEGIHSTVDTVNQLLLLYGIKRSKKPADKYHPFGYGKELYFWSFIVSILIFGLGGGLSVYQGIQHMIHPEPMGDPTWNYVVLVLSFIFEGSSLIIAVREFNALRGDKPMWQAIVGSKDPSSFLVLFEDGAAVLGLVIVFVLMQLSHALNLPVLDGLASLLVGLLLIFVSLILARESRSLLMGEGIAMDTQRKIIALAEEDPAVMKVISVLSTYQSPDDVVLVLVVHFKAGLETEDITDTIERVAGNIRKQYERVHYVLIQPQSPIKKSLPEGSDRDYNTFG